MEAGEHTDAVEEGTGLPQLYIYRSPYPTGNIADLHRQEHPFISDSGASQDLYASPVLFSSHGHKNQDVDEIGEHLQALQVQEPQVEEDVGW